VLAPDPEVEKRDGDYLATTWEREMAETKVVTTLPKGSPFTPRQLVVGVKVGDVAKAWSLDDLKAARVQLDVVGGTPLMIVVGDDGKSVRVFDRRIDGRESEFAALLGDSPWGRASALQGDIPWGRASALRNSPEGLSHTSHPVFLDVDTGSEWDFAGRAISGPLKGRTLARIPHLLEYWFDWQTHQPKTLVHKPWNPVTPKADPLTVPKPEDQGQVLPTSP
jgi:hypothetical protein